MCWGDPVWMTGHSDPITDYRLSNLKLALRAPCHLKWNSENKYDHHAVLTLMQTDARIEDHEYQWLKKKKKVLHINY